MTITYNFEGEPGTLHEFADIHHLSLTVRWYIDAYYARFAWARMKLANGALVAVEGVGNTPQKAIDDYAEKISGTLLHVITHTGAPRKDDEYIAVPGVTGEPT